MAGLDIVRLLNRRHYSAALESHWSRPTVERLTRAIFAHDPMRLRGFGVPADEYEPEALLCVAQLCGHGAIADFLATAEGSPGGDVAQVRAALCASFEELFGASAPPVSCALVADALRAISAASSAAPSPRTPAAGPRRSWTSAGGGAAARAAAPPA